MRLRSGKCTSPTASISLLDLPEEILLLIYQHNSALIDSRQAYDQYLMTAVNRCLLVVAREALFNTYEMRISISAHGGFEDLSGSIRKTPSPWRQQPLMRHTSIKVKDLLTDNDDHYRDRSLGHLRSFEAADGMLHEYGALISRSFKDSIRLSLVRRLRVTVDAYWSEDDATDAVAALRVVVSAYRSLREVSVFLHHQADGSALSVISMLEQILGTRVERRTTNVRVFRSSDIMDMARFQGFASPTI